MKKLIQHSHKKCPPTLFGWRTVRYLNSKARITPLLSSHTRSSFPTHTTSLFLNCHRHFATDKIEEEEDDPGNPQKFRSEAEYLQILGAESKSDLTALRRAYNKQVLTWHPDRFEDKTKEEKEEATRKFGLVRQAYEQLTNPSDEYREWLKKQQKLEKRAAAKVAQKERNDRAKSRMGQRTDAGLKKSSSGIYSWTHGRTAYGRKKAGRIGDWEALNEEVSTDEEDHDFGGSGSRISYPDLDHQGLKPITLGFGMDPDGDGPFNRKHEKFKDMPESLDPESPAVRKIRMKEKRFMAEVHERLLNEELSWMDKIRVYYWERTSDSWGSQRKEWIKASEKMKMQNQSNQKKERRYPHLSAEEELEMATEEELKRVLPRFNIFIAWIKFWARLNQSYKTVRPLWLDISLIVFVGWVVINTVNFARGRETTMRLIDHEVVPRASTIDKDKLTLYEQFLQSMGLLDQSERQKKWEESQENWTASFRGSRGTVFHNFSQLRYYFFWGDRPMKNLDSEEQVPRGLGEKIAQRKQGKTEIDFIKEKIRKEEAEQKDGVTEKEDMKKNWDKKNDPLLWYEDEQRIERKRMKRERESRRIAKLKLIKEHMNETNGVYPTDNGGASRLRLRPKLEYETIPESIRTNPIAVAKLHSYLNKHGQYLMKQEEFDNNEENDSQQTNNDVIVISVTKDNQDQVDWDGMIQ